MYLRLALLSIFFTSVSFAQLNNGTFVADSTPPPHMMDTEWTPEDATTNSKLSTLFTISTEGNKTYAKGAFVAYEKVTTFEILPNLSEKCHSLNNEYGEKTNGQICVESPSVFYLHQSISRDQQRVVRYSEVTPYAGTPLQTGEYWLSYQRDFDDIFKNSYEFSGYFGPGFHKVAISHAEDERFVVILDFDGRREVSPVENFDGLTGSLQRAHTRELRQIFASVSFSEHGVAPVANCGFPIPLKPLYGVPVDYNSCFSFNASDKTYQDLDPSRTFANCFCRQL